MLPNVKMTVNKHTYKVDVLQYGDKLHAYK